MNDPSAHPDAQPPTPIPAVPPGAPGTAAAPTEQQVWDALRECYDPEIPVNVVDLGLIYDVVLNGNHVTVKMTLTARGCPMSGMISREVQTRLSSVPGVAKATVDVVWEPPWHPSMISPAGRKALGME